MNWTKASAIAEILSSIAILATLVYLSLEIEQNAEATEAEVRQAMLASDQQFLESIFSDPNLHLTWYKPELTDEEKVTLSYFLISHFRMRENNWFQNRNGTLDDATWDSYQGSILAVLSSARTRHWWENFDVDRLFDARFIEFVNELIADSPIYESSPHLAIFD